MTTSTEFRFVEEDGKYMYFEVVVDHVWIGTIYMRKVQPLKKPVLVSTKQPKTPDRESLRTINETKS